MKPNRFVGRLRPTAAAIFLMLAGEKAWAFPQGPQVAAGAAQISQAGNVMNVQNSAGAILNWQKFGIAANEIVRFQQPSAASAVLNRVVGPDPSQIYGQLQSNGTVWLVNPAGVMIGPNGRIDTAGFVASTLAVTNQDFLAGRLTFGGNANAGAVTNRGGITTPSGGQIYLVAPEVHNDGSLVAPNGEIVLAAGRTVQLMDTGTPGIRVEVAGDGRSTNLGRIVAEAGQIGMAGLLVRNGGTLNASSVVSDGGRIFLKATGSAVADGDAQILAVGEKGGEVRILGRDVAVAGNAVVDASGRSGGGTILVGGDYQGKNSAIPNAWTTELGGGAVLKADALDAGDGGKVIVWADDATRANGTIFARGGRDGGAGGFVETSGHSLDFSGIRVDASSFKGRAGTWLIDPEDLTIDATGATNIGTALDAGGASGTNVSATTSVCNPSYGVCSGTVGDIVVSSGITWTKSSTLSLTADGNISINAPISGAIGGLSLAAIGAIAETGGGTIAVSQLTTHSGNGTTLSNNNAVSTFNATNDATGVINLTNTVPLSITGITQSGSGNVITITNSGVNNDISVDGAIHYTYTGGTGALLQLKAGRSIVLNAPITSDADHLITTLAAHYSDDAGVGVVKILADIDTKGGNLTVGGGGSPVMTPAIGYPAEDYGVYISNDATVDSGTGMMNINGQGCQASGSVDGIVVSSATLQTSGGSITLKGWSGNNATADSAAGIKVSSATISAAGNGNVWLQGTGSTGINGIRGVLLDGATILASNGMLEIEGYGGNATGQDNQGVLIQNASLVKSTGSGQVRVSGEAYGGSSATFGNHGVSIADSASTIESTLGDIQVWGTGVGSGTGYGGADAQQANIGIANAGWIKSASSSITLTGTHGGAPAGASSYGVDLQSGGQVSTGGAGNVTLQSTRDVALNGTITLGAGSSGSVSVRADKDSLGSGTVSATTGSIQVNGSGRADIFYHPSDYNASVDFSSVLPGSNAGGWMLVYGAADLQTIATKVAAGEAAMNGSFALVDDIATMTGFTTPIGTVDYGFSGKFNGFNHTITGLSLTVGSDHVGLFGRVSSDGSVSNLELINPSINNSSAVHNYIGTLVGYNEGSIANCKATNVSISDNQASNYIGGLVGTNYGTIDGGRVIGGSVTAVNADTVGGLAGRNGGAAASISNSSSTASVRGQQYVGGLVADNSGAISSSFAAGAVIGSSSLIGGLVGLNDNFASAIISDSFAMGDVSSVGSTYSVGGLVGQNKGVIERSFATGNVSGGYFVGGLVGANWGSNSTTYGSITDAYAMGVVYGGSGSSYYATGGLVGKNEGAISNSYSTGSVSNASATDVGGFVGLNAPNNGSPASIANSFWNTATSGNLVDGTGVDTAVGKTTAQLMSALDGSWNSATWGLVAGVSYPYLKTVFTNGIQVLSGTVSNPGSPTTMWWASDGKLENSTAMGADGFYYFGLPNGSIDVDSGIAIWAKAPSSGTATEGGVIAIATAGHNTGLDYANHALTFKAGAGKTFDRNRIVTTLGALNDSDMPFRYVSGEVDLLPSSLLLTGGGNFSLSFSVSDANNITTLAAANASGVTYHTPDWLDLAIGTVGGVNGITASGSVDISTIGIVVNQPISASYVNLAANNGSISGSALISGTTVVEMLASSGAIGPVNTRTPNLTASASGDISIINNQGAPGTLHTYYSSDGDRGFYSSSGSITLENYGAIVTGNSGGYYAMTASGDIAITAHSPITIGTAGVTSTGDGNVTLTAGSSGSSNTGDVLTINGPIATAGAIALNANSVTGTNVPSGANVTTNGVAGGGVPDGAGQVPGGDTPPASPPPTLTTCIAAPATAGCEAVLPTLATCTSTPSAAGCEVVLPPLATCTSTPSAAGCSAVLPTLAACTATPAAAGCEAVLPPMSICTTAPATPGCTAVLPTLAACTATPMLAGCTAVLPTVATCTTTPTATGCSAVLPTVAACVVSPSTPGCSAVLPTLATCTSAPATAGCSAVLPTLATCTMTPTAAGCGAVLPAFDTCVAAPATAGCSAVLPTMASCVANPSAPGCSAVLPGMSDCAANPALAGCSAVVRDDSETKVIATVVTVSLDGANVPQDETPVSTPVPPPGGNSPSVAWFGTTQTVGGTEGTFGGPSGDGAGTLGGSNSAGDDQHGDPKDDKKAEAAPKKGEPKSKFAQCS